MGATGSLECPKIYVREQFENYGDQEHNRVHVDIGQHYCQQRYFLDVGIRQDEPCLSFDVPYG
jgi:hypothetical protein